MDQQTFKSLSQKIYQLAGFSLPYSENNVIFFQSRLSELLAEFNFKSYQELDQALLNPSEALKKAFISSLTTNKTDFFRETDHFEFLKNQIFPLLKTKAELRIWSAACSLGSEAYTMALMAEKDMAPAEKSRLKILATDIDREVLQKAVAAQFSEEELEGVPLEYKSQYFEMSAEKKFQLRPSVAGMVQFSEFNLLNFQYRFQKRFDAIFCRNVLIYFDQETANKVVDLMVNNLELKGHLFVAHSEAGVVRHASLKSLGNSIYQKVR